MSSKPIAVVGQNFMAGEMCLHLLREGHPVVWIQHIPIPPKRTLKGIPFDPISPSFRRDLSAQQNPKVPKLKIAWEHHRVCFDRRIWEMELSREFGEPIHAAWKHPQRAQGTHHAKQLHEALAKFVSLHHAPTLNQTSLFQQCLEATHFPKGLSPHDQLEVQEMQITSLGGEIWPSRVRELVYDRSKIWGLITDDYRGTLETSQIMLTDHLLSFQHMKDPVLLKLLKQRSPVHSRRFTFFAVLPRKELPQEFEGEAILLSHPDFPVIAPHALFVEEKAHPDSTLSILGIRMDCPLKQIPLHSNQIRDLIREALRSTERTMFSFLYDSLEELIPSLSEVSPNPPPISDEWFMNLTFRGLPDQMVQLGPGCWWYGPEAWGSAGLLAEKRRIPLPPMSPVKLEANP